MWSGLQVYKVNGKVVKRFRSFKLNDVVQFQVGNEERHDIKVVLKSVPLQNTVHIDGALAISNLFEGLSSLSRGNIMPLTDIEAQAWKETRQSGIFRYAVRHARILRGFLLSLLVLISVMAVNTQGTFRSFDPFGFALGIALMMSVFSFFPAIGAVVAYLGEEERYTAYIMKNESACHEPKE